MIIVLELKFQVQRKHQQNSDSSKSLAEIVDVHQHPFWTGDSGSQGCSIHAQQIELRLFITWLQGCSSVNPFRNTSLRSGQSTSMTNSLRLNMAIKIIYSEFAGFSMDGTRTHYTNITMEHHHF